MLADDLNALSDALDRFAASANRPLKLTIEPSVTGAAADRAFADAVKRGQTPELVEALKSALKD